MLWDWLNARRIVCRDGAVDPAKASNFTVKIELLI